jgi:sialate O-acetylesterase
MNRSPFTRHVLAALFCAGVTFLAQGQLRFANVFGDHQVLQRDRPVPVWGWATPEAEIEVTFNGQRKTAKADADGRWRVVLDPMPAGAEPLEMIAKSLTSDLRFRISDILVGDVWLCAGPGIMRNMGALQNSKQEIAKATFPQVRILRPDTYSSIVPVADIPPGAAWTAVSPETIEKYSITWYVGRELQLASKVPVGIILANMPTDLTQEWLPWRLDSKDKAQAAALKLLAAQLPNDIARTEAWLVNMRKRAPGDPIDLLLFPSTIPYAFYSRHPILDGPHPITYKRSNVYNTLINPLLPMAIRGIILNCEFESKHGDLAPSSLKELVESWRSAWGRSGLPFVVSAPVRTVEKKVETNFSTAVATAGTLPNVATMTRPSAFSEQASEAYWKSVADTAMRVPTDEVKELPKPEVYAHSSPIKLEPCPARRRLEVAHLFVDNMVLQCNQPLKVWGWSEPGDEVTVAFAGQMKKTTAAAKGRWELILDPLLASDEPRSLKISSSLNPDLSAVALAKAETLTLSNVLVGEVWINSGQSNSGYVLSATLGFAEEQPLANYPAIRYFANARAADVLPQRRNMGKWLVVSPETAGHMSGMGYYFARAIHKERLVPVGIIESNHGGSSILSWMSDAAFTSSPKFAALAAERALVRDEMITNLPIVEEAVRLWVADARRNAALKRPVLPFPIDISPIRPFYSAFLQNPMQRRGSMFYNAMIYPMAGYGVRGALWNQGEADGGRTAIYDELMLAMVSDWRKSWGCDFPFYYVQMPARKGDAGLCQMWDAQARALAKIPKSGMIVCNDISEAGTRYEVHPRDKKSVGERLARLALFRTYGVRGMVDASPMMESVARDGQRIVVTFSTPGDGLKTRDNKPSDSWELAGTDGKFLPAKAEISGAKVMVSAAGVATPVSVRLGWTPDSNCNLVNSENLPAMPFSAIVPNETH